VDESSSSEEVFVSFEGGEETEAGQVMSSDVDESDHRPLDFDDFVFGRGSLESTQHDGARRSSSLLDHLLKDAVDRFTRRAMEIGKTGDEETAQRRMEVAAREFDLRAREVADIFEADRKRSRRRSLVNAREGFERREKEASARSLFGYQTFGMISVNFSAIMVNATLLRMMLDNEGARFRTLLLSLLTVSLTLESTIAAMLLVLFFMKRKETNYSRELTSLDKSLVLSTHDPAISPKRFIQQTRRFDFLHSFSERDFIMTYYIAVLVSLSLTVNVFIVAFS